MNTMFFIVLALVFYLLPTVMQARALFSVKKAPKWLIFSSAMLALVLHAFLLYRWIDIGSEQNLAFFNVLSQVCWFIAGLTLISTLRKPFDSLLVFVFPLAMLSIVLAAVYPGQHLFNGKANPMQLPK